MKLETERPTNFIQVYFKNPQIDQQFFRIDFLEVWQGIHPTIHEQPNFNTSAHDKVHNKNFHFICRHCFAIFCPSHTLFIITHDEYLFYTKFEYEIFPKKKNLKRKMEILCLSENEWIKTINFQLKENSSFFLVRAKSNIYIACFNILRGLDGLKNQLFLEFFYGLFLNNKVEK